MARIFTLGGAAADFTATMFAMSETGADSSISLILLSIASLFLSLWGTGVILYTLLSAEPPAVFTVEEAIPEMAAPWRAPPSG